MFECWLCLLFFGLRTVSPFLNPYPLSFTSFYDRDIEQRLMLTPYIKSGRIREAKQRALVNYLDPSVVSYSGFITVDEDCGSNLFFWFFLSQNDWLEEPVSIWLNGGPGSTSLFGMFMENGPYQMSPDGKLKLRKYSWNRNSSVLYIDNPVGTGYSFTEKTECYATNELQVGQNLLAFVEQFFLLFPELADNPFFLTGESYAGKYLPALAYAIHNSEEVKVNLQGIAIGNGLIDPVNQQKLAEYLFQCGLIDRVRRDRYAIEERKVEMLIKLGLHSEANQVHDDMLRSFTEESDFQAFFNILREKPSSKEHMFSFLKDPATRKALHVGNSTWHDSQVVRQNLLDDIMRSVKPWLEELLEHYKVLIYSGQLDIIVAYPLTANFLQELEWSSSETYKLANRSKWYVGDELAGYSKSAGNLIELLVRNSGHMVPTDQPKWAFDLYQRFIFNQSFN